MKKLIIPILMLITLILFTPTALASSYFEDKSGYNYTMNDGLPSNQITSISTTSDGVIWMGGYNGIIKYFGTNFENYARSNDLSLQGILSLTSDDNVLYIGTQSGLLIHKDDSFQKLQLSQDYKISDIAISETSIALATKAGLIILDKNTYKETAISCDSVASIDCYNNIFYLVDESGNAYSYNNELKNIDTKNLFCRSVDCIDGYLYFGGNSGKFLVESIDNSYFRIFDLYDVNESMSEINSFYKLNDIIYIGTHNGLYILENGLNNPLLSYVDEVSLSQIVKITSDYQGNIWLVSNAGGAYKIGKNSFISLFRKYGLDSTLVNAFAVYKNKYYIGEGNALIELDPVTKTSTKLLLGRIRDLKIINNKLYIANYKGTEQALVIYDGNTLTNVTNLYCDNANASEILDSHYVRCIGTNGSVTAVGTEYGITLLKNDSVYKTINSEYTPLSITMTSNRIVVCYDVTNVTIYDLELNVIDAINKEDGSPLKSAVVDDDLYFSENCDVYKYNLTTKAKTRLNISATGSVTDIFKYKNNLYFATTACEVFMLNLDKASDEYKSLGRKDGFISGATPNGSGYLDEVNGVYYYSCQNGVYYVDLVNINESVTPIKIIINKILINDSPILPSETITINKNVSRLTIEYNVVCFTEGEKSKVYYKLNGVDNEFTGLDSSNNQITYTNLKGGTYKLEIYVTDSSGNYQSDMIEITISKEFYAYEQAWFWIVTSLLSIAVIYAIAYTIVRHRLKEAKAIASMQRDITRESIIAIATSIDAKDKYTNGHSLRVGEYTKIIAEAMGFKDVQLENIYYTGLLHDVGKIGVPDNVLNKPGRLDDNEFAIIKTHTVIGADILKNISTIKDISLGARNHHEKWNGSGYPDGLKGEEIPLISRIICCADCYDAMATKRVYKEEYSDEIIISEFEKCAGTQFDPEISRLVIDLIKSGKLHRIDAKNITK